MLAKTCYKTMAFKDEEPQNVGSRYGVIFCVVA